MTAAIQGRAGELWAETGSATTFTTEACDLVTGTTYHITATTKRQWDPGTTVQVYDNGVLQTTGYTIKGAAGRIVFASAPTTPVTVSGKYWATAKVGYVTNWELNIESTFYDVTALGDTAKQFVGDGCPLYSGSFEKFHEAADSTWADRAADNADHTKGQSVVLKLYEDRSGANRRAWVGYATMGSWSYSNPQEITKETIQFSGDGDWVYLDNEL